MNPQATKKKVIVALVLVVIYILSAAFDFHPTIVAPVVVVLLALTFFFPSFLNPGGDHEDAQISASLHDTRHDVTADVAPQQSVNSSSPQIES